MKNWVSGRGSFGSDRPEVVLRGGNGAKGEGRRLVLVGGDKAQYRRATGKEWSKTKVEKFLSVLAETCNVTRAAAEAEVSVSAAYRRRKGNAGFRSAWLEAIGSAYQRLELVLLERAFVGTEKIVRRKDGSEERMMEYPNQLALTLLKMHRDTAVEANAEIAPGDVEEIRERLIQKLQRLQSAMRPSLTPNECRFWPDTNAAARRASEDYQRQIVWEMSPIDVFAWTRISKAGRTRTSAPK